MLRGVSWSDGVMIVRVGTLTGSAHQGLEHTPRYKVFSNMWVHFYSRDPHIFPCPRGMDSPGPWCCCDTYLVTILVEEQTLQGLETRFVVASRCCRNTNGPSVVKTAARPFREGFSTGVPAWTGLGLWRGLLDRRPGHF